MHRESLHLDPEEQMDGIHALQWLPQYQRPKGIHEEHSGLHLSAVVTSKSWATNPLASNRVTLYLWLFSIWWCLPSLMPSSNTNTWATISPRVPDPRAYFSTQMTPASLRTDLPVVKTCSMVWNDGSSGLVWKPRSRNATPLLSRHHQVRRMTLAWCCRESTFLPLETMLSSSLERSIDRLRFYSTTLVQSINQF